MAMDIPIYCKCTGVTHYKSELPKTLQPYIDYQFSSGGVAGKDFLSFDTKYRNAIKKLLPGGYALHSWHRNHYESSGVIKTPDGRFIYISYSDVRCWPNEWATHILIRSMAHEKDWRGGINRYTSLFSLTEDVKKVK